MKPRLFLFTGPLFTLAAAIGADAPDVKALCEHLVPFVPPEDRAEAARTCPATLGTSLAACPASAARTVSCGLRAPDLRTWREDCSQLCDTEQWLAAGREPLEGYDPLGADQGTFLLGPTCEHLQAVAPEWLPDRQTCTHTVRLPFAACGIEAGVAMLDCLDAATTRDAIASCMATCAAPLTKGRAAPARSAD